MTVDRVEFASGGVKCVATRFAAVGNGRRPCVVLAHGFGFPKDAGLAPLGEAMAAAGLVALSFDYRHFGESEGEPRQLVSIRRQQQDIRAALDFARGLDGVDPSRVALWGYSYGGGHAIAVAARDRHLAAVVARAPFVDGLATALTFPPSRLLSLVRTGLADQLRGRRACRYQPLTGPAGSSALFTDPEEVAGYLRVAAGCPTFSNRYAPRANLYFPLFRAVRDAGQVACPLLVTSAERDTNALPRSIAAVARRAPQAELRRYPGGHFDLFDDQLGRRVIADEADWLARQLKAAPA